MKSLRIRIGVNLVMAHPDAVVDMARHAEACGYDSEWTANMLLFPFDTDFPDMEVTLRTRRDRTSWSP